MSLCQVLSALRYDYCQSMEDEPQVIEKDFPFVLAGIYLTDTKKVTFDYWHTQMNSQLDVQFEYKDGEFRLRRYGMFDNITDDWYKTIHEH